MYLYTHIHVFTCILTYILTHIRIYIYALVVYNNIHVLYKKKNAGRVCFHPWNNHGEYVETLPVRKRGNQKRNRRIKMYIRAFWVLAYQSREKNKVLLRIWVFFRLHSAHIRLALKILALVAKNNSICCVRNSTFLLSRSPFSDDIPLGWLRPTVDASWESPSRYREEASKREKF